MAELAPEDGEDANEDEPAVEEDADEPDVEEDEEEEEEEYFTVLIAMPDGEREFFTNDPKNGEICEVTADGDIGETVGRFL